jgi:hypothetical protein
MLTDHQRILRLELIRKQATEGDSVCTEYLSSIALDSKARDGRVWIETQLDMEDDDDDFRPY